MLAVSLALAVALSACLAADDEGTEARDAGGDTGQADAAAGCALGPANPDWLLAAQDLDLRRLTGVEATPQGATLSERSSAGNRAATRDFLQARFGELGYDPLLDDYGSGVNVFAELPATLATDRTIVVGAHFDSVPGSPGANDNATGVAMVLAAARYASTLPCRSENLIFVLFDEEEIGLVGSDNFAQLLRRPAFGAEVTAVHTIDQNGWDEDGDRAFELERPDASLMSLYLSAKELAGATMPIQETATGSTDHVSFRAQGFDAIGVTEEYVNGDTTPHYHLASDTYATVNRDYLASTTRIFLTMLASSVAEPDASPRQLIERLHLADRYRAATIQKRTRPPLRAPGCRAASLPSNIGTKP